MSVEALKDEVEKLAHLDAETKRLAAIDPVLADAEIKSAASENGWGLAELRKRVARARPQAEKDAKGRAVKLYEPEPWLGPVDGAAVLDEAYNAITRHMVMRDEDACGCALWMAHQHVYELFAHSPRLLITAPDAECGKTLLMYHLVGSMTRRPQQAEDLSPAPFFRLAEEFKPCFLIDEVDTFIEKDADILGAINNGWEPHGCVLRCVGDDNEVRAFSTHAPVAMAGIDLGKKLPATTISRSIVISLDRASDDELGEEDDYDARKHRRHLLDIGRKFARWCGDHSKELREHEPTLPPKVRNRLADKWRPLFAVAEVAGGHWPELARKALFAQVDMGEPSKALQLLSDTHETLKGEARNIHSFDLINMLCSIEDSIWADYNFRAREAEERRIQPRQLAALLKRYKVEPRKGGVRAGKDHRNAKGYHADDLKKAWSRYLPRQIHAAPPKNGLQGYNLATTRPSDESQQLHPENNVTHGTPRETSNGAGCNAATPISTPAPGNEAEGAKPTPYAEEVFPMLIDKLKEAGVSVEMDGNNLRVRTPDELTDEQRQFIRERKAEIRAELRERSELPDHIKERLRNVVEKLTSDCVSWYRDDGPAIEQLDDDGLERVVLEYCSKRDWYRRGLQT